VGRHGQFCIFLRRDHRHQYLLEVTIAARMSEPDISGTKSIPELCEAAALASSSSPCFSALRLEKKPNRYQP
ncbi:hypothetical protein, partial [Enterobacter cloacae]|uniref:hypothetical protein n=1 Tax=Enterobacter cloacae TaxID=550 RepID=UPI0019D6E4E8